MLIVHIATLVFCHLSVHIGVEYDISIPRTKRPVCGSLWLSAPRLRMLPCCHTLRVLCLSWARSRCRGWPVPACPAPPLPPCHRSTPRPAKITPHPLGGSCPGSVPVASPVPLSGSACPPWVSALPCHPLALCGSFLAPLRLLSRWGGVEGLPHLLRLWVLSVARGVRLSWWGIGASSPAVSVMMWGTTASNMAY